MAARFSVSRGTLREALRMLASMNLITTTRGVQGGSSVTIPSPDQLLQHLGASLQLLAADNSFTLAGMLEVRRLLEVPAVGFVAERATEQELDDIRATVRSPPTVGVLSPTQSFHVRLARATTNPMLETMLYVTFEVHNLRIGSSRVRDDFVSRVVDEHELIAEALADRDADAARQEMERHFVTLQHMYDRLEPPADPCH